MFALRAYHSIKHCCGVTWIASPTHNTRMTELRTLGGEKARPDRHAHKMATLTLRPTTGFPEKFTMLAFDRILHRTHERLVAPAVKCVDEELLGVRDHHAQSFQRWAGGQSSQEFSMFTAAVVRIGAMEIKPHHPHSWRLVPHHVCGHASHPCFLQRRTVPIAANTARLGFSKTEKNPEDSR